MDYEKTPDEKVYQEARKLVGGDDAGDHFQRILPALLGGGAPGTYGGYDAGVNPVSPTSSARRPIVLVI